MATTINNYSDELEANLTPLYAPLPPNRSHGRVRAACFRVTLASQAAGEDVALCIIPKGARILAGSIIASATLANSAQISIGLMGRDGNGYYDDAVEGGPAYKADGSAVTVGTPVADAVAAFKAAAVQSTTAVAFCLTQALGYGYETAKDIYVTMTTSVGTVATEVVTGYVLYALD